MSYRNYPDRETRNERIRTLHAEGSSPPEIAAIVGCDPQTVREVVDPELRARRNAKRAARYASPEGLLRQREYRGRPRRHARTEGRVSLSAIARKLGVNPSLLTRLYRAAEIAGIRVGREIWLDRRSLAAYLWSRPRCIRNGCDRRVIGPWPGCHLHRRDGRPRRHSEETKRKMSETRRAQAARKARLLR